MQTQYALFLSFQIKTSATYVQLTFREAVCFVAIIVFFCSRLKLLRLKVFVLDVTQ